MDQRTKIIAGLFAAVLGYVAIANVVYPQWIAPLLHIDERIAEKRAEHLKLKSFEADVAEAKGEYRHMVGRIGAFDVGKAETDVRARLNDLVERYQLEDVNVTPSRASEDRKTGVTRMQITLNATGKLAAAVQMFKEAAEFPHLLRVGSATIYPASSPGRQGPPKFNLRIPMELLVLPQHRLVGRINPEEMKQPERFVRHEDRDYSVIWTRKPFTEPIPLTAQAGKDINVKVGQKPTLVGSASGGEPPYTYQWAPSDRLENPTADKTGVDASSGWNQVYTLTVTDGAGETATSTLRVAINEPVKPPEPAIVDTTSLKPQPVDTRWPHRKQLHVTMALMHKEGDRHVGELMLSNNQSHKSEFYTIGDEFDGGKLAYVHPLGGVVHRSDEYFLVPIGAYLDQDLPAVGASREEHGALLNIVERLKEAAEAAKQAAAAAGQQAALAQEPTAQMPSDARGQSAVPAPSPMITPDQAGPPPPPGPEVAGPTESSAASPSPNPSGAQPTPSATQPDVVPAPKPPPPGGGGSNSPRRPPAVKSPNNAGGARPRAGEARLPLKPTTAPTTDKAGKAPKEGGDDAKTKSSTGDKANKKLKDFMKRKGARKPPE